MLYDTVSALDGGKSSPTNDCAAGVFTSVADLSAAISTWATHWNTNPTPFIWKATAEDIIAKVRRGRETLNHINSQTHH